MATVIINGVTIQTDGDNVNIVSRNGQISVNGNVAGTNYSGTVKLEIQGAVASIDADGSVTCANVSGDIDAGGSVNSGDVGGDVDAGGSVKCNNVKGNVDAGGSVHCNSAGTVNM